MKASACASPAPRAVKLIKVVAANEPEAADEEAFFDEARDGAGVDEDIETTGNA